MKRKFNVNRVQLPRQNNTLNRIRSTWSKLKVSHEKITAAHKVQTDAIQGETRGEESEYSLLFAHAQDTLMTIYSEINIAKQLLKIFKSYEARIAALEEK